MVAVAADGSNNLDVNCQVGCSGGSTSNATSGVATSSTNTPSVAYNYGFNGTTWDQLQVDASKFLKVDVGAGSITANAGTNLNTSLLALESGGNLATAATNTGTIAGAVSSSVMQSNTKQVNGVTTLAGAGATGTGSQRFTVAQDTTTIAGSGVGTAGSPSTNVVSIQGVSSGTVVPISGTVTANAGTGTFTISGAVTCAACALETGGNLATIAGAITSSVVQTNEKQINGVTPLMNNGVLRHRLSACQHRIRQYRVQRQSPGDRDHRRVDLFEACGQ